MDFASACIIANSVYWEQDESSVWLRVFSLCWKFLDQHFVVSYFFTEDFFFFFPWTELARHMWATFKTLTYKCIVFRSYKEAKVCLCYSNGQTQVYANSFHIASVSLFLEDEGLDKKKTSWSTWNVF